MRPRGVLLKDMPGTMAWGHSGKCKSCIQPHQTIARPVKIIEEPVLEDGSPDFHLADAISALNSFMTARRRRLGTQASKPISSLAVVGQRLPAPAPKAAAQRPMRRAA